MNTEAVKNRMAPPFCDPIVQRPGDGIYARTSLLYGRGSADMDIRKRLRFYEFADDDCPKDRVHEWDADRLDPGVGCGLSLQPEQDTSQSGATDNGRPGRNHGERAN